MNLKPAGIEDLSRLLAEASRQGEQVVACDLSALDRLLEHKAEDMTCRVQAGVMLAGLQKQLAQCGQWLPLDPPRPESLSIAELLDCNPSGPRRFGYGTVRDYLLGLTVVLADGRVVHSGGNVVKNVAGYDLMKVFVGSRGSLGVIVEATFKLRPIPETENLVEAECASLDEADKLIGAVLESEVTPIVLDLYNPGESQGAGARPRVVLGFAGTREEVDWQMERARELGFPKTAALDYDAKLRGESCQAISVLPSKLVGSLRNLGPGPFVARAGNGVIYHAAAPRPSGMNGVRKLEQRLKDEFDPKHIFPALKW